MVSVSLLTNAVSDNIDKTIQDLEAGTSPALAIQGLLMRDVQAMFHGGPEQGLHFVDAANAWFGDPKSSVATTYEDMHAAYFDGWMLIAEAVGRRFIDEHKAEAVTFSQTALAENVVMQVINKVLELEDAVIYGAEVISAYFIAVTEPA